MNLIILTIFILIIVYFLNLTTPKKLCIMAIFKNEEEYLEEWIIHHLSQGISHFYLYCNDPDINKYMFLNKYVSYITLIPWVEKQNDGIHTIQKQAYTHCIQNYNNEYEYIMMLDIDEFIISTEKSKNVLDIINTVDISTKAIKVPRYDFGSNNHKSKPKGSVMDNYKMREKICSSYKTIANSEYIDASTHFYGVHDFPFISKYGKVYNNYFTYKHTGFPNGCTNDSINEIPLIINHYYTKSYDEYMKRCHMWKDGGVNNINYRQNCEEMYTQKNKNEILTV
jgi:hypothetical protein